MRPWWDRLLCWAGLHYWSYPGGPCQSCEAPDELWGRPPESKDRDGVEMTPPSETDSRGAS